MMKPYTWKEGMSPEEAKDGAYWERNMLALRLAVYANDAWSQYVNLLKATGHDNGVDINKPLPCGWYYDTDNNWDGWKRVISLYGGRMTFHIPDDFDLGNKLPQIEPNWDGHTTEEKWYRAMAQSGCEVTDDKRLELRYLEALRHKK